MSQNIKRIPSAKDEVSCRELVVRLFSRHAKLHIGCVSNVHKANRKQELVKVLIDFPPICEFSDHCE